MAVTARLWVAGELNTATKMNTIRADLLEVEAVAGFEDAIEGTISLPSATASNTATIAAVSDRAILSYLGTVNDAVGSAPYDVSCRVELTDPTTVTAVRGGTNGNSVVGYRVCDPRG